MFHGLYRIFALATVTAYLTATLPTAASAAVTILYVSTTGNNSNPCTLAQPCRRLQRAINLTPVGGEVHVLDSGFYGNNANIRKSMTIVGNGHTVLLGNPIIVAKATATVAFRRLVLNGQGSTQHGINIVAARSVHIEQCTIHDFTGTGINADNVDVEIFVSGTVARNNGSNGLQFDAATTGGGKLTVENSRFSENGFVGLSLSSQATASISRSVFAGNIGAGVYVLSNVVATITSSTSALNGGDGYRVVGGDLTLESSVARGNGANGVYSHFNNDVVRLSNSVITENVTGVRNGGAIVTRQNNIVEGNGTDLDGAAPALLAGF